MIDVVIATRNRAGMLPETLESLRNMHPLPRGGWRLVVVNNGSSDNTREVLDGYREELPLITLEQPCSGRNISLNTAIPNLEGDLVVFTDDDIVVPPNWLYAYEAVAAEKADFAIFGGRITPLWPFDPPRFTPTAVPFGPAFAVHPPGLSSGPIKPDMIWGGNMAVRRAVFDAGYRFENDLGPMDGPYIIGGETDLLHRLAAAGYQSWFSDDIVVRHRIRKEQLTARWLRGRAAQCGRRKARKARDGATDARRVAWRVSGTYLREACAGGLRCFKGWMTGDESRKVKGLWQLNYYWGALREQRRL